MINKFHSLLQSSRYKFLLFILVFCLFFLWGAGSYFSNNNNNYDKKPLIKVGNYTIFIDQFISFVNKELVTVRLNLKKNTLSKISQFDIVQNALQRIIHNLLLDNEVNRLGLVVDDLEIRNITYTHPSFINQNMGFDRIKFDSFLRKVNLSEKEYISFIRRDILRSFLVHSLSDHCYLKFSQKFFNFLINWQKRSLSLDLVCFFSKNENSFFQPLLSDCVLFHQNNFVFFTSDEVRDITYILHKKKINSKKKNISYDSKLLENIKNDIEIGLSIENISKKYFFNLYKALKINEFRNFQVKNRNFLSKVFSLPESKVSFAFIDNQNDVLHFCIVRIDKIYYKSFDSFKVSKQKIHKLWQKQYQMHLLKKRSKFIVNFLNKFEYNIPSISASKKTLINSFNFKKNNLFSVLNSVSLEKIFNLSINSSLFVPFVKNFSSGYFICSLKDILFNKEFFFQTYNNKLLFFSEVLFSNDVVNTFILGLQKDFSIFVDVVLLKNIFLDLNLFEKYT